jgi:hypothetical protein
MMVDTLKELTRAFGDSFSPGKNGLEDSILNCEYVGLLIYNQIEKAHGEKEARRIYAMWGTPPTARRVAQIKNEYCSVCMTR